MAFNAHCSNAASPHYLTTLPHSLKFFDGAGGSGGDHVFAIWIDVVDAILVLA